MPKGLFIGGAWRDGRGEGLASINPATDEIVWKGNAASKDDVHDAVLEANTAVALWAERPLEDRVAVLNAFAEQLAANRADLAELISRETGKPLWESRSEVESMRGKVGASIEANRERRRETSRKIGDADGWVRYKPHGVVAVLGPFNLPGHLPNGHIVPALLAGNSVVFKPSELTPGVAEKTLEIWEKAQLPRGVINLVQGSRDVGEALIKHPQIDGVFFTGSYATGRAINRALADEPGKILALEMGGNNPLVVHRSSDLVAAAHLIVQSAFITAGQRCSCARRLILMEDEAENVLAEVKQILMRMIVGHYTAQPEPFMGPVISAVAAEQILAAQSALESAGGTALVPARQMGKSLAFLTPGIVDVTGVKQRADAEVFGPLLQVVRVKDLDDAIEEANRTCYGLAAGLLSDDRDAFERFYREVRAGVINFNRPLTGASGLLPFGGVGCSGNNRPSAYFAADYCSYPVASLVSEVLPKAPQNPIGFHQGPTRT